MSEEMVLQHFELPVGEKRYQLNDFQTQQLSRIFNKESYLGLRAWVTTEGMPTESNHGGYDRVGVSPIQEDFIRQTEYLEDEDCFVIKSKRVFHTIDSELGFVIRHLKGGYVSSDRSKKISRFAYFDNMKIRIDTDKQQIVVLNQPYEGPLEHSEGYKDKLAALNNLVIANKNFVIMASTLVGNDIYLANRSLRYTHSDVKVDTIRKHIVKLIKNKEISYDERVELALCLKQIKENGYCTDKRQYKYAESEKNFSWYAGLKTNVLMSIGAYELPDNYLDWFNQVS